MSDCIKKGLFELLNNVYFTGFFLGTHFVKEHFIWIFN